MKFTRFALAALLLIVALNALGGGWYGMAGAKNVPLEWLEGSPFSKYFIPSLILFVAVGVLFLVAGIAVIRKGRFAPALALICAAVLMCWIIVQVLLIGFVSWLQPAMAGAALLIFWLAYLLRQSYTTSSKQE